MEEGDEIDAMVEQHGGYAILNFSSNNSLYKI